MAQLKTKFLEDNAVNEDKLRISNGAALRGRNNAGSGDLNLLEVTAGDLVNLLAGAQVGGSVILKTSDKGANNGVAELDGSGKLPTAQLPTSAMEYKGAHDVATNSPTLIDGTGDNGDMYRVSVGGSRDYGSGSITLAAGDALIYNGSIWQKIPGEDLVQSVNGAAGVVVLDTDDIAEGATNLYYTQARFDAAFTAKDTDDLSEGATNLYFTNARAKAAAVADAIADAVTDVAPSQNAVFDALALKTAAADLASTANSLGASLVGIEDSAGDFTATDVEAALAELKSDIAANTGASQGREVFTLIAGDITAQKVVLANTPLASSVHVYAEGVAQVPGVDFTESGADVAFAGDLATGGNAELVAGDVLVVHYEY